MARRARQVIEYRVYELDMEFPVLLLDGEKWHISETKSSRLHFHNCLEIGICHSDSGTLLLRDSPIEFRAGDVTCIPRHIPHTTYSAKGAASLWSYIFVDLQELLSDMVHANEAFELADASTMDFQYLMNANEYPKVHSWVSSILDELRTQNKDYRIVVKALFLALYYELARIRDAKATENAGKEAAPRKDSLAITAALDYINVSYMNKITIEELSGMCHLSATHFRRLFLSIMGSSPLSFINSTRIGRACTLLQTTEDTILHISEAVGFSSISSFNRCFSNTLGVSPRDYRNAEARQSIKPQRKYILQYSGWFEADP